MFIEIEGYNGASLLLAVDKIVSVTTYTNSKTNKSFTAVRTVVDKDFESMDEEVEGFQQYYQSNESYESIMQKIMVWYKPTWTITPQ